MLPGATLPHNSRRASGGLPAQQASARQWRALRGCGLVFSIGPRPNTAAGYNTGGTFIAGTGGMFFLFNAIVLRPAVLNC
jgi:hypothetical protein